MENRKATDGVEALAMLEAHSDIDMVVVAAPLIAALTAIGSSLAVSCPST